MAQAIYTKESETPEAEDDESSGSSDDSSTE